MVVRGGRPRAPRNGENLVTVSIVIATYNRSDALVRCLESLHAMERPAPCEVVVVDNASTDGTRQVVESAQAGEGMSIRYLFEPRRGKSAALNAGIAAAQGEIMAFTDDDCVVDPEWMRAILDEFAASPELALLGGRVELGDPRDIPITIVRNPDRRRLQRITDVFGAIIGANMALRRGCLASLGGGFDLSLGPGTPRVSEDLDIVYRAYRCGLGVAYSPRPLVYHNHGRRTESDLRRLLTGYNRGLGAFYLKHILKGDREALKSAFWDVRAHVRKVWGRGTGAGERRRRLKILMELAAGAASEASVTGRFWESEAKC